MAKGELISCVACGHEVAKSAKACPNCGATPKKPFGKTFNGKLIKWICILYIFIGLDFVLNSRALPGDTSGTPTQESATTTEVGTDLGVLDDGTNENTGEVATDELTGEGTTGTEGTISDSTDTTKTTSETDTTDQKSTTENSTTTTDEPIVNEDGTIDPVQIVN